MVINHRASMPIALTTSQLSWAAPRSPFSHISEPQKTVKTECQVHVE